MKYDFETEKKKKKTDASKYASVKEGVIAMNVADMEFKVAPCITQALHKCVDEMNPYGYQNLSEEYYEAVISWMKRRHHFDVKKEWICFSGGVVNALNQSVKRLTQPNDGVIIFTPVYGPFYRAVKNNDRQCAECALINDHEFYSIDFEDFERKCADPNNKMLLLCSPHNPVGKVFTKEELTRICEICLKHNVLIVADEIHHDIILTGSHTCIGTFPEVLDHCIICTAPSKTFNLAGLAVSNIIIPNEEIRKAYMGDDHVNVNPFSMKACIAAYNEAEEWLEEMIQVVAHNAQLAYDFLDEHFPQFPYTKIEGTYLWWVNMKAANKDHEALCNYLKEECDWYINDGAMFGTAGKGYIRVNLALPTHVFEQALQRLINKF